ncbi:hypothetical protein A5875_002401, partial [Enterococcus sp. 3H8_DIV0648]
KAVLIFRDHPLQRNTRRLESICQWQTQKSLLR